MSSTDNHNPPLKTLSERLCYALEVTGTKKAELSRLLNIKPQIIQFLCNSNTKSSRYTFEIATALKLNVQWLANGQGNIFIKDNFDQQFLSLYQKAPLLDCNQIIKIFKDKETIDEPRDWTYVLKSYGETITFYNPDSAMEPVIPGGAKCTIKLIEPNQVVNRAIVLVYVEQHRSILLRKTHISDKKIVLIPENKTLFNEYTLDNGDIIIGCLIEYTGTIWGYYEIY